MSSTGTLSDSPAGFRSRIARAAWIESPAFDGFLLIFAPLTILPIVVCAFVYPYIAAAIALTLAFAHYASSFAFYLWDENRDYYRTRWLAFFAGPVFIAIIYALLIGFKVPNIIQFMVIAWNTWHVARQNCGILSIYRNRAGIRDPAQTQRTSANNAIVAVSVFMMLWNIDTFPEVVALFSLVSPDMTEVVKITAGIIATGFLCAFAIALVRRNEKIGLPEGLFLVTSLAFFYPYLFIRTSAFATSVMLLPHYLQYMALVWMLHRRKFGEADAGAPVALRRVSSNLWLLVPLLFVVGFAAYLMKGALDSRGYQDWFENIYLLIAFTHFYLDGLIWAFRRPHVRQTILPFLLARPQPVAVSK